MLSSEVCSILFPGYNSVMIQDPNQTSNRSIIRKVTLQDEGRPDPNVLAMTFEQRVLMVWPLTVTAWKFKDPNGFQQRLQRHVARVERR